MVRIVRQFLSLALALGLLATGCAREDDGGLDIRRRIKITSSEHGRRVFLYELTPGMAYERAVEIVGGDPMGEFFGAKGPIMSSGQADFGTDAELIALIEEGRIRELMFVFAGEHRALERLEARIGEALAALPRGQPGPGQAEWIATEAHRVRLAWNVEKGRDQLEVRVVDLGLR